MPRLRVILINVICFLVCSCFFIYLTSIDENSETRYDNNGLRLIYNNRIQQEQTIVRSWSLEYTQRMIYHSQQLGPLWTPETVHRKRFGRTCTMDHSPCHAEARFEDRDLNANDLRSMLLRDTIGYPSFHLKNYSSWHSSKQCGSGIVRMDYNDRNVSFLYYDAISGLQLARQIDEDLYRYCGLTFFHMYWAGVVNEQVTLAIESYLVTQDLSQSHLTIWTDRQFVLPLHLQRYTERFLSVRVYNVLLELEWTDLPQQMIQHLSVAGDPHNKHWSDTDLLRVLILYNYGGVYMDADVLLLRDLAPILGSEWNYLWGTEDQLMNGAVMRFFRHSHDITLMLQELSSIPAGSINWGAIMYHQVRQKYNVTWQIYPTMFFNPTWIAGDLGDRVKSCEANHNYPGLWNGPFAIHLHGGIFKIQNCNSTSDYKIIAHKIKTALQQLQ